MPNNPLDFLKNIAVNLSATGTAALLSIWCIAVAMVGIFGSGENGHFALMILGFIGATLVATLGFRK